MVCLSVVIPTYNALDTIVAQLDSIFGQPRDVEIEVVVADNGSTDGTVAALRERYGSEPAFHLVDASQRRGGAHAKNVGVAAAKGEFVGFCDADDLVAADWVNEIAQAVQINGVAFVPREYRLLNPGYVGPAYGRARELFGVPVFSGGAFGCRRDFYLALGGFDDSFLGAVDDEFAIRLFLKFGLVPAEANTKVHVRLRSDFQGRLRRAYHLALSRPELASRFPALAPAQGVRHGLRRWGSLAKRAATLTAMTRAEQDGLAIMAATASGYLVGSWRARKIFL